MRATSLIASVTLAAVLCELCGCAAPAGTEQPGSAAEGVQRERIEWCDIWVTDADKDRLPRVLLIGDSITRGYFQGVEKRLEGKASCARVTTSKCIGDPGLLPEVELLLDQYRFDVVHVNNGMHGWSYSEEQYGKALGPFMQAIIKQGRGARVIWAHTTPVMSDGSADNKQTQRVKARNAMAAAFAAEHNIPIDDLFTPVVQHPEYFSADGVHLSSKGIEIQAAQVADCVLKALEGAEQKGQ